MVDILNKFYKEKLLFCHFFPPPTMPDVRDSLDDKTKKKPNYYKYAITVYCKCHGSAIERTVLQRPSAPAPCHGSRDA